MLLLVRHAKAGSRQQWDGDDALRPLSGTGREQARHLAELLPLFGPDRIVSAPPRALPGDGRAAGRRGSGWRSADEPLLGEAGYEDDPAAALARLRELAAQPGVTVVCSQGGVIPDLVGALARRAPVAGRRPGRRAVAQGQHLGAHLRRRTACGPPTTTPTPVPDD